jgi:hypothetical protein
MCLCYDAFFVVCFTTLSVSQTDLRQCSGHSDWLRAGQPRGRNSSPSRVKNFLAFVLSRPALGPTQPSIQWVQGALSPEGKVAGM